ncbi:hypothetical protein M413DRAFT_353590 [Hebeloma cylindrosporum]|uniref:Fungal-type protein kinase domain-containing protein n=1 Tax=Hebeloma cylindrosporum TaxID=76867 RepID=A0A0C3CK15_HEBCY|nr:hypothetical protein M413DRAFT_353590 [Hebeloma cylindrosporum h7]
MPLETALTSKVVDLSKAEYFIEVKNGKALDPFVDNDDKSSDRDPDYPFEAIADMRILTRGQILAYCTAIARSQFRTHVFGVIIIGTRARILRWDPSAMVVTSLFDYTEKENNLLAQFIWHYENASPHTRGHDTSVKSISTKVARKRFGTEIMGQVRERNPHHSHFCIMNISDRETEVIQHSHLISYPPPYQRISPFGRITRTLHAFDEETKEFVFVKDYWRVMADGMAKESDIYKELEKHKVPNIAPFGNGNDVMCEAWSVPSKKLLLKLVKTRHENGTEDKIQKHKTLEQWRLFRMSLRVIGDGLETFKSTKQLVGAIADAMEAHDAALFDARILHRDISVGNILIHGNRGLLIDWDLCFLLDGKVEGPRRAQRTGTWQFMSAAILQNPTKVHDISDDRESAFHVLTWTALCYGRHTQRRPDDLKRLLKVYDYSFAAGKYIEGGELKRDTLLQYKLSKEVSFNPPLDRLIKDLAVNLRARYIDIEPSARAKLEATKKKIAQFEQAPGGPEAHRDVLEALRDNCTDNPAFVLSTLMKQLETRGWLVKKMRKYLQESGWPLDDKVRPEGLHETSNSKKRSRDKQDDSPVVLEGQPKSKVEKRVEYADVSSSRTSLFRSGSSGLGRVMEEEED